MMIQFIYTFKNLKQKIVDFPFQYSNMKSRKELIEFATSNLKETEKQDLLKISSCIYINEKTHINIPKWYLDCDGKFWF